jgi:hypothetical protein
MDSQILGLTDAAERNQHKEKIPAVTRHGTLV